jgi:hypothetical protein
VEKKTVLMLALQVASLWNGGKPRIDPANPYELPARLAYLSSILGLTPSINCLSGKDRTGLACGEISKLFMLTQSSEDGCTVPQCGERNAALTVKALVATNSLATTQANTGTVGLKVRNLRFVGHKDFLAGISDKPQALLGASKMAKA